MRMAKNFRLLDKSDLGGVIFCCNDSNMDECLSKKLFGLTVPHILYVKNIEPGLPMFLFNFSDRKLHGIYEAVGSGKMNIDPYAWTAGGSDRTNFPAQVKIRERLQCPPLSEDQFKPIIADNYFKHNHFFRFELDRTQASNLISMLSSSSDARPTVGEVLSTDNADFELEKHIDANQDIISQLTGEVEELKAFMQHQALKLENFETKLLRKIYQLESRCTINKSIFLVGGYDGVSFSSALDSFSPSCDAMKSCKSMAICLGCEIRWQLYVFGGGTDTVWYDTVESYNVYDDQWHSLPSLSSKKGCLAAAALKGKLYSVDGGNGVDEFSDVEMLDPNVGRWVPARPMLKKRFALSAVEWGGSLYAVGGFNGDQFLSCAERYDPRERSWDTIRNMKNSRTGHSLTLFNEKIYAIGSFDGRKMIPIVEMYEPRVDKWIDGAL
ncbi:hypothetical protein CASFOL_037766 [Castilleja foliolosa]|uniref:DCD domain-containing protein n=1 Tax=Castilleja foliolosa TaxID=1961234 RepID=A0ABD3BJ28_9LAMI